MKEMIPKRVTRWTAISRNMSHSDFEQIQTALNQGGTAAALDCLEQSLRSQKKYHELFEALKMKLRQQLDLPLWYQESASDSDLDGEVEERLEKGLLDACQQVGMLLLDEGRVREAWMYLRPVGNKTQVAERLRQLDVADDQIDELIEVTVYEGVDPATGFARILDRYGTCNAITTFDSQAPAMEASARRAVAGMLVRHLHQELVENVRAHIERQEEQAPPPSSLRELCDGRDWLLADGSYHIDTSHLSSVVRCGRLLEDRAELELALDLAEYGERLDKSLQYAGEEPFADNYRAHRHYFQALLGRHVDAALAFFRQRAETVDAHQEGTLAIEVYIELLARCGKLEEALDTSLSMLPPGTHTRGAAPSLLELSRQAGNYEKVTHLCRERGDLLGFATALLHAAAENSQ